MRILHVGFGFRPFRPGGLIAYAEDVMEAQVRHGEDVGYFFSGRHYPFLRGPRLHRWTRNGVRMLEVLNTALPVAGEQGTRYPERELSEPGLERVFRIALARFAPDVVHLQELAGLPSSVIEIADAHGTPMVFTLQDYYVLCPTFKLFDVDGLRCERLAPGATCRRCCARAPGDMGPQISGTRHFERERLKRRLPRAVPAARRMARAARWTVRGSRGLVRARAGGEARAAPSPAATPPPSAAAYDRRRALNVARMNRVDGVVAMSDRVAELFVHAGVERRRVRTLRLTLESFGRLTPRRLTAPPRSVHFAALNAGGLREKGAGLLIDAVDRLDRAGAAERYRLTLLGPVAPAVDAALARRPSVTLAGPYDRTRLDGILEPVDVGIVPSVWEEAYGYVGIEFLAKGIPVIGSARGGIPDYVRPGETGWLNESTTGEELADIMLAIIHHPEHVLDLHRSVVARREALVKPMEVHLRELSELYGEVIAARGRSAVVA